MPEREIVDPERSRHFASLGRKGALVRLARYDARELVQPALDGQQAKFERQVDPENKLSKTERARRADAARRAHMQGLALKSVEARRRSGRLRIVVRRPR